MSGSSVDVDVVLIGAGIMSATLGAWLRHLEPGWTIRVLERLDRAGAESSDAWNNAGTGHAALCELNYTPEAADGTVPIGRAVKVASAFEVSRQFWASLVARGVLPDPAGFVTAVPHRTFVTGDADVGFLRRRHAAMAECPLFAGTRFSVDPAEIGGWMPLVMDGRDAGPVAATSSDLGTDVNFGALTRALVGHLVAGGAEVAFHREVVALDREGRGWRVTARDPDTGEVEAVRSRFVFVGAGGGALPVLQLSAIPEARGYGGFPVSGQWLVCRKPALVRRHAAKVYGRAEVGAPPMSVPHLDTRIIGGERALLFGPFAGFSTRFLKHGSLFDLPLSVRARNVWPMLTAGADNLALTRYLVEQVVQSPADRHRALRRFVPTARLEDWSLELAGQRVQVIKADEGQGGVLEFGTEVVASADGTIAALLGASPGASTAASILLGVLERCFPERWAGWQEGVRALVPAHGVDLARDAGSLARVRARCAEALGLAGRPPLRPLVPPGILMVRRPGDAHRLASEAPEVARRLAELSANVPGGRIDGERVVAVRPDAGSALHDALGLASSEVAAAVGSGDVAWAGDAAIGAEVARVRQLCDLARVGEVLVTDRVAVEVPLGVGTFEAPKALSQLVGFPVRALRDFR